MKIARKSLVVFLLAGLILASCAGQSPDAPTPDIGASLTAGVGTIVAYFFQTQTAMAPAATMTPSITPLPEPTGSPVIFPTIGTIATPTIYYVYLSPTPTGTVYTPTVNPSSLAYGCNNLLFISDVTIPAGTLMKPGETFTKTWKVANNGTCNWLYGYRFVPISGAKLAQDAVSVKNAPVPPGEWRQQSITMVAPTNSGSYTQYWQLSDGAGHGFGSILAVSIVVSQPTKTPKPTGTATSTSTATNIPTSTNVPTNTDVPTATATATLQ